MPSYADQIAATVGAHSAVNALETRARQQATDLIQQYVSGLLSGQQIRYRLEALVRQAYRASGEIGSTLVSGQADLEDWSPRDRVFSSTYLNSLLSDVRRNLRDYKDSEKDVVAQRRLQLRVQASIGVGSQRGYTDAQLKGYKELKDIGYQLHKIWWANFVNNTPCPMCESLHGQVAELDEDYSQGLSSKVYHNLEGPPRHPNCFIAGTRVTGPAALSASERIYEGELVELTFGEGEVLTGTPNHPILTTRGWIPLGELVQGDQLLRDSRVQNRAVLEQHDYEHPALIENVFESLSRAKSVFTVEMPTSAPDFHGDGTEGQVSVVHTDGSLLFDRDASLTQESRDLILSGGHVHSTRLVVVPGSEPLGLDTVTLAPTSSMGALDDGSVLFGTPERSVETVRLRTSTQDSSVSEDPSDWAAGYAQSLRDSHDTLAFEMSVDDFAALCIETVTGSHHFEGSVPVYNLETAGGWYTANGIVTHNCQCTLVVLITTLENTYESMDYRVPQQPATDLSTEQVRNMPQSFFAAVIKTLKKIISKFSRRS